MPSGTLFDLETLRRRYRELETRMSAPGFWDKPESAQTDVAEFKSLKEKTRPFDEIESAYRNLSEILELCREEGDEAMAEELASEAKDLKSRLGKLELSAMMDKDTDRLNCYLSIHAGAGGTDSSDWASMLMRMYVKWMDRRGYSQSIVDYLPNDEAGIKRVVIKVSGPWAYGFLRSELGVHRLVRISPFDFNQRRHTSFASVDLLPQFEEEGDIAISDGEIEIDTYRSSGAGGQHVNVTDSAVRITHIPTGIIVQCQNERSQHRNRAEAMSMLKAKLMRIRQMERESELKSLYSEKGEIAWGNQIRSYVLHPYTLVKDHRTDFETGNVQAVLDGEIDDFQKAFLMMKRR